jgi:hypothetical protein
MRPPAPGSLLDLQHNVYQHDVYQHDVTRWRRRSVASLLVLRYLLISNGLLVAAVGFISLLYVERPAGFVVAGAAWLLAGMLFGCIPFTDPYRSERTNRRRP